MPKRIYLMQRDETDTFNDEIDVLFPFSTQDDDTFTGFRNYSVQRLLKRAAEMPRAFVLWVNDTPRSYTSQVIRACPQCGRPMKRVGRGATLKKHGPRYVCGWVAYWRERGLTPDEQHEGYERAWSVDELCQQEATSNPDYAPTPEAPF
ncbi:MAG TPA: zinc ribbon domain-containing protein [Roseiflexaceae bacterium]|nr:zinc ribbon domain-containing protein [Roseiflexaceae bacterium]